MDFAARLETGSKLVEGFLEKCLDKIAMPSGLRQAMNYSLLAGGKRLRPVLCITCAELFGLAAEAVMPFAAAIECIHSYSLIHDDLPAMDDDDLRRGEPSCHVKFGEAAAILAGDGLLNRAFEIMAEACLQITRKNAAQGIQALEAMKDIADASGAFGMVGGQTVDIISENRAVDGETLRCIHERKTAALIAAAFTAGARLAGASADVVESLKYAGMKIGLAFQIKDDISDVTKTTAELGKPAGSDAKSGKNTYVSVFGMEQAEMELERLSREARSELSAIEWRGDGVFRIAGESIGEITFNTH